MARISLQKPELSTLIRRRVVKNWKRILSWRLRVIWKRKKRGKRRRKSKRRFALFVNFQATMQRIAFSQEKPAMNVEKMYSSH